MASTLSNFTKGNHYKGRNHVHGIPPHMPWWGTLTRRRNPIISAPISRVDTHTTFPDRIIDRLCHMLCVSHAWKKRCRKMSPHLSGICFHDKSLVPATLHSLSTCMTQHWTCVKSNIIKWRRPTCCATCTCACDLGLVFTHLGTVRLEIWLCTDKPNCPTTAKKHQKNNSLFYSTVLV